LDARLGGGGLLEDIADKDAALVRHAESGRDVGLQFPNLHAEVAAPHDAVGEQRLHDVAGQVAGHRQADALEAAAARLDGRVDADDLALQVDQWATTVARVNG